MTSLHPAFPPDMTWEILPGRFSLVGYEEAPTPAEVELALSGGCGQVIREGGETTLLLPSDDVARLERANFEVEHDLLWIRFVATMAWDVVGFLAAVTGALAARNVPLGAVCGFSRDHLFIAAKHEPTVRETLASLFPERREPARDE